MAGECHRGSPPAHSSLPPAWRSSAMEQEQASRFPHSTGLMACTLGDTVMVMALTLTCSPWLDLLCHSQNP